MNTMPLGFKPRATHSATKSAAQAASASQFAGLGKAWRVALIGCGTHNQLLALKLLQTHGATKKLSLIFFDSNSYFDQAKTISCHSSDVPCELKDFMAPYWKRTWSSYFVKFPVAGNSKTFQQGNSQKIELGYQTLNLDLIKSELVEAAQNNKGLIEFVWNTAINHLTELEHWASSRSLPPFDLIVDTRSQTHSQSFGGVQQFYGATYRFPTGHGYTLPVIMDATCEQSQDQAGYRFVYFLPLSEHELLIEDTRLLLQADHFLKLETHVEALAKKISQADPSQSAEVIHREKGLIPIPFLKHQQWQLQHKKQKAGSSENIAGRFPLRHVQAGMGAGFFHPTTGYSLPLTLESIAILDRHLFEQESLENAYQRFKRRAARSWNFALLFNFFLFYGFKPSDSLNAFSYFYRLPSSFIRAFYSCKLNALFLWVLLTRLPPARFQGRRLLTCLRLWIFGVKRTTK